MNVPPDIKAAVDAIFDKVEAGESIADAMCRALQAERERAAKIAEGASDEWVGENGAAACLHIAEAIRS